MIRDKRWKALPCILLVALSMVFIIFHFSGKTPLDSNVLNALPSDDEHDIVSEAVKRAEGAASRQITLVVYTRDTEWREQAADDLVRRLEQTGYFITQADQGHEFGRWLFLNRAELLCPDDKRLLQDGGGAVIVRQSLAALYTPGAPISGDLIAQDPFLLVQRLAHCLTPKEPNPDNAFTIVAGRLNASPFRVDVRRYHERRNRGPIPDTRLCGREVGSRPENVAYGMQTRDAKVS